MKAAFLFVTILAGSVTCVRGATADTWIAEPPPSIAFAKNIAIPDTDIFEVVASMRRNAETELREIPILPLSDAQARKFTGPYYSCPKGKRAFLVRAIFGFPDTGKFWVYRIKNEMWVLHQSAGPEFIANRTALVVNLDFVPSRSYVTLSVVK